MCKKLLSLLLICLLMLPCFPALAENGKALTCGDYKYTLNDDGTATINKYIGNAKALTVPTELDGHIVTRIGGSAFVGCYSLDSITLPDSLTSIGDSAFDSFISSVIIPASVTSIGDWAFFNNRYLTLTIPKGSYVEQYALSKAIPYVYSEESDNPATPTAPSEYSYTLNDDGTATITGYTGSETMLTVPKELDGHRVTAIGERAFFRCEFLTSVMLPDGLSSIGEGAFLRCSSLTKIVIPDSLTSIGAYAFSDCTSLTDISIPDSLSFIDDQAFSQCKSLTSICFPDGITSIGYEMCFGCKSLVSVTIPDSVTSIGVRAFSWCNPLTSVAIPDNVAQIGAAAFWGCPNLTLTVPRDSYAEQYAESAGIPYVHPIGPEILIFPE